MNNLQILSFRERLGIAGVVFLHLVLVIPLAAVLNLWIDEAYTLQSTGSGLTHALHRALGFESQPPLYFLLITVWREIDASYFFVRLFSVICTAATVATTAKLMRRYLPDVHPILGVAIVAFNPLTVFLAVNARFYAIALLLSALLLLYLHEGYLSAASTSERARRKYVLTGVAALYTHYFLGFILAAGAAALAFLRSGVGLRRYLMAMVATATLFAPLAIFTVKQVQMVNAAVGQHQDLIAAATKAWWIAWQYVLPSTDDELLKAVRSWTSRLAVPLLLVVVLVRRRRPSALLTAILVITSIVGLLYLGVAMRLGEDFMRPEHATVLFLPVVLSALGLLNFAGGARVLTLGVVGTLLFDAAALFETYAPLAKPGDWIRVSQFIESREANQEPILVFRGEYVLDFRYHYAGRNQLVPLPRAMGEDHYDPRSQVLSSESEIFQSIEGKLGPARRFWVVTRHTDAFRGIDVHPEILEDFLSRWCTVLEDRAFLGVRVRLVTLRSIAGHP